ncbi:MAG: hypothetical protein ACYC9J_12460 [Sulfuricaulis sp.]
MTKLMIGYWMAGGIPGLTLTAPIVVVNAADAIASLAGDGYRSAEENAKLTIQKLTVKRCVKNVALGMPTLRKLD